jgi:hypothetical protein
MHKLAALALALLAAALALPACTKTTEVAEAEENCVPAPAEGNKPGKNAVNTVCPIMQSDAADGSVTVTHKGQTIALCCVGCIRKFNALDDAGKDNILTIATTYAK